MSMKDTVIQHIKSIYPNEKSSYISLESMILELTTIFNVLTDKDNEYTDPEIIIRNGYIDVYAYRPFTEREKILMDELDVLSGKKEITLDGRNFDQLKEEMHEKYKDKPPLEEDPMQW